MEPTTSWIAHERYVLGLCFGPDDQALVSSGMEGAIKVWSLPGGPALRQTLLGHSQSANTLALGADGKTLVSGSTDQTVRVWSLPDGAERLVLHDRKKTVAKVDLSPHNSFVGAAWYGGRATVWTLAGELVAGIRANDRNVVALAFSPDERTWATGGLGDNVRIWSLPGGALETELVGHQTAVLSAAFLSPTRLLSVGHEGTIRRWDTVSGRELEIWHPNASGLRGMLVDPMRDRVMVAAEGEVQILSLGGRGLAGGTLLGRIILPVKAIGAMAISHDGRTLAIGTADSRIRLYDLTHLMPLHRSTT